MESFCQRFTKSILSQLPSFQGEQKSSQNINSEYLYAITTMQVLCGKRFRETGNKKLHGSFSFDRGIFFIIF